jgi:hypothetical protein
VNPGPLSRVDAEHLNRAFEDLYSFFGRVAFQSPLVGGWDSARGLFIGINEAAIPPPTPGGWSITVRSETGVPTYTGINTLVIDESTGLTLTSPADGQAQVGQSGGVAGAVDPVQNQVFGRALLPPPEGEANRVLRQKIFTHSLITPFRLLVGGGNFAYGTPSVGTDFAWFIDFSQAFHLTSGPPYGQANVDAVDASPVSRGVVNTVSQSYGGQKEFLGSIVVGGSPNIQLGSVGALNNIVIRASSSTTYPPGTVDVDATFFHVTCPTNTGAGTPSYNSCDMELTSAGLFLHTTGTLDGSLPQSYPYIMIAKPSGAILFGASSTGAATGGLQFQSGLYIAGSFSGALAIGSPIGGGASPGYLLNVDGSSNLGQVSPADQNFSILSQVFAP